MNTSSFSSLVNDRTTDPGLKQIAQKVIHQERISMEDGILLFEKGELSFLGSLANLVRENKNGNSTFFNHNFHIEPTNVCVFTCKFCSYSRVYKHREEGWELSEEQMLDVVKSFDGKPVTEVHIVGGVHPKMNLDFFLNVIRKIKAYRPELHVKAFTVVELDYMFRKANVTVDEGLKLLQAAGLNSLPGGGAEIFNADIRNEICGDKCSGDEWLNIHETAHRLGIQSNATMLYGHIENFSHRIEHMEKLRQLQDKTRGFNTFIPLKFRNVDNDMSHLKEVNVTEDLRNYAVSRIYLDNFNHLKAYWPMIGRNTAQLSQSFGVDDLDGTIDDTTKIYSMAGAEEQKPALSTEELVALISQSGRTPVERDSLYHVIRDFSLEAIS